MKAWALISFLVFMGQVWLFQPSKSGDIIGLAICSMMIGLILPWVFHKDEV